MRLGEWSLGELRLKAKERQHWRAAVVDLRAQGHKED